MPKCYKCGTHVSFLHADCFGFGKALCSNCRAVEQKDAEARQAEDRIRQEIEFKKQCEENFDQLAAVVRELFPDKPVKHFIAVEWTIDRGLIGNVMSSAIGKGFIAGAVGGLVDLQISPDAGKLAAGFAFTRSAGSTNSGLFVLFQNGEMAFVQDAAKPETSKIELVGLRYEASNALHIDRGFPMSLNGGCVGVSDSYGSRNLQAAKSIVAEVQSTPLGRSFSCKCSFCGRDVTGIGVRLDYLKNVGPELILGNVCLLCGAVSDATCGQSGIRAKGKVRHLHGAWPDYGGSACSKCGAKLNSEDEFLVIVPAEIAGPIAQRLNRPMIAAPPIIPPILDK